MIKKWILSISESQFEEIALACSLGGACELMEGWNCIFRVRFCFFSVISYCVEFSVQTYTRNRVALCPGAGRVARPSRVVSKICRVF